MQPLTPDDLQTRIDLRFRMLIILWSAFAGTILIYYFISLFVHQPNGDDSQNRMLTFMLTAAGIFFVVVSTAIKQKFLSQSMQHQRLELVQTGYILAFAFCETAALLGLIDRLVTGNRYYYVLLVIAALGLAVHWPRREHLLAACDRRLA